MELDQPFAGIEVVEFGQFIAVPFCAQVLSEGGARVIKVESPNGGDESRSWGPPFVGPEDECVLFTVNVGEPGDIPRALAIAPEDGPSMEMLERCREYIATPPPADWPPG